MRGLARVPRSITAETAWQEVLLPSDEELQNLREPHESEDGTITAIADWGSTNPVKVVVAYAAQKWTVHHTGPEKVRRAWRGPDGGAWAATIDGLFAGRSWSTLVDVEEVSARQYFDVALEPGGAEQHRPAVLLEARRRDRSAVQAEPVELRETERGRGARRRV